MIISKVAENGMQFVSACVNQNICIKCQASIEVSPQCSTKRRGIIKIKLISMFNELFTVKSHRWRWRSSQLPFMVP